jgi:ParB family chromosome partitioning protein
MDLKTIEAFANGLEIPLSELLGEPSGSGGGAQQPPLYRFNEIHPSPLNPRKSFDNAAIIELALSIAEQGLLQNLVLRPRDEGGYWIVAGERRYRAIHHLAENGLWDENIPNISGKIIEANDAHHLTLALLENLQRQDINPMDEAEAMAQLHELDPVKFTTAAIAKQIGVDPRYIQQRLALAAKLSQKAKTALRAGKITFSQARALTSAKPEQQDSMVKSGLKNWPTERDVRNEITRGLIPASRAIFDAKTSGLELVETDEGKLFFVSKEEFLDTQLDAAYLRSQVLGTEYAWVEIIENIFYPAHHYLPEQNPDDRRAGALIQFDPSNGEVYEHLGLYKKPAAGAETQQKGAQDDFESQFAKGQAKNAALTELVAKTKASLRYSPFYALRLLVFVTNNHNLNDVKAIEKAWSELIATSDEKIIESLSRLAAEDLSNIPHRQNGDRLHPVLVDLAQRYHLPIPEILLSPDERKEAAQ